MSDTTRPNLPRAKNLGSKGFLVQNSLTCYSKSMRVSLVSKYPVRNNSWYGCSADRSSTHGTKSALRNLQNQQNKKGALWMLWMHCAHKLVVAILALSPIHTPLCIHNTSSISTTVTSRTSTRILCCAILLSQSFSSYSSFEQNPSI